MPRTIVFALNGVDYEADIDDGAPVRRADLTSGQLTVEHPSESYAVYMTTDGYSAHPIIEQPDPARVEGEARGAELAGPRPDDLRKQHDEQTRRWLKFSIARDKQPRLVCPECGSDDTRERVVHESWQRIDARHAPEGFADMGSDTEDAAGRPVTLDYGSGDDDDGSTIGYACGDCLTTWGGFPFVLPADDEADE